MLVFNYTLNICTAVGIRVRSHERFQRFVYAPRSLSLFHQRGVAPLFSRSIRRSIPCNFLPCLYPPGWLSRVPRISPFSPLYAVVLSREASLEQPPSVSVATRRRKLLLFHFCRCKSRWIGTFVFEVGNGFGKGFFRSLTR